LREDPDIILVGECVTLRPSSGHHAAATAPVFGTLHTQALQTVDRIIDVFRRTSKQNRQTLSEALKALCANPVQAHGQERRIAAFEILSSTPPSPISCGRQNHQLPA